MHSAMHSANLYTMRLPINTRTCREDADGDCTERSEISKAYRIVAFRVHVHRLECFEAQGCRLYYKHMGVYYKHMGVNIRMVKKSPPQGGLVMVTVS